MKILAIRIKNLASLEGITEINFTKPPLNAAGIFAITGATGAGKSTILDALCLALYGKTPRYLQAKEQGIEVRDGKTGFINQGDCRGILRDGTGEGYAEVDFKGVDGNAYTATWRVRRARDKADGLMQGDSLELKNLHSGVHFPGRKKEIADDTERLIGLNFEQFTRSVLLAQGDFTAFLKAAKDDKSSLLEKLTGTHIYSEISKRVFENHKTEEQQLRDLNIRREGIITLTVEELALLEERNKAAKEEMEIRQAEILAFDKELNWHHQFKLMADQVELARNLVVAANENKQNASGRLTMLTQVEGVQPARKLVDEQNNIAGQLAAKLEDLAAAEKNVLQLNKEGELSAASLITATNAWKQSTQKYELAKPLLAQALQLDIKISGKLEQVSDAALTAKLAADTSLQKQQLVKTAKEKNTRLLNSVKELRQWKADNESRQPIAEQESLILSKLKDAQKFLSDSQQLSKDISGLGKSITTEIKNIEILNAAALPLKTKLQDAKENNQVLAAELSETDIAKIEIEKISVDHKLSDLTVAEAHWENLFEKSMAVVQLAHKLANAKGDHAEKEPQLQAMLEELKVLATKKEIFLEQFQKASLAVTENVEALRGQLVPGEACLVCGSMEHPYATDNPQLNVVMKQLEEAYKSYEKVYGQAVASSSALQENILLLEKSIETTTKEFAEKEEQLKTLDSKWKTFIVYPDIQQVPDEDKAVWLAKERTQTLLQQQALQKSLGTYHSQKAKQEELQKQVTFLEEQLNDNTDKANKSRQARELLEQKLDHLKNENEKLDAALQLIKMSLHNYFANEDWFLNWQKDPAIFEDSIKRFATSWKEQTKKLADDTAELKTMEATLQEQELQLKTLMAEEQSKQALLTGLQHQYHALLQERKLIFDGADAAQVETGLQESVEKALQNLELQKTTDNNIKTAIAKTSTLLEQLQKDRAQLQQQAAKAAENTEGWLIAFNKKYTLSFNLDKLSELLAYTHEWIDEERKALRAMDDAITQARSVSDERSNRLRQHEQQRLSERSFEELETLKISSGALLQQASQQKTETTLLIQQDEKNKRQIGELLNAINAQGTITDNWAKLNDIIGSSDGKKFRQMAQEYTLDVLLGYANMHLQSLSQRYLLQRIPNTLGLQVLDQDMGNEVRTVFSLSGGESFLVSLALALGLASLSSSRMQVESLFIDEGFGSLDPSTLNIAMDALERLHNQGRKVGVISHVQEMTERIPVQIMVSKENSGKSRVEVIGF